MNHSSHKLAEKKIYIVKLSDKDCEIILKTLGEKSLNQHNVRGGKLQNGYEIAINHIYRGMGIRL